MRRQVPSRLYPSLLFAALSVTALGCQTWHTTSPEQPVLHPFAPIPKEHARVCVVRTSRLAQAIAFPTWDNDKLVGVTRGPTFFCYFAEPGDHEIRIQADSTSLVTLHAVGGRSYYLHQQIPFPAFTTEVDPVWVGEAQARELIDDSEYEIVTETPELEKVPEQPPIAEARAKQR